MNREAVVEQLMQIVRQVDKTAARVELKESASLVKDLGFDSMQIGDFVTLAEARFPSVDLTPWFIQNAQSGADTIGSLADVVMNAMGR